MIIMAFGVLTFACCSPTIVSTTVSTTVKVMLSIRRVSRTENPNPNPNPNPNQYQCPFPVLLHSFYPFRDQPARPPVNLQMRVL